MELVRGKERRGDMADLMQAIFLLLGDSVAKRRESAVSMTIKPPLLQPLGGDEMVTQVHYGSSHITCILFHKTSHWMTGGEVS